MNRTSQSDRSNGHHPAPPVASGAFFAARPQTVFPPEAAGRSPDQALYELRHAHLAGVPLVRLLWVLGILLALAWAGGLPGGLWVSGTVVATMAAMTALLMVRARGHFVRFRPGELPLAEPAALAPSDKVPVWVTGKLAVSGRTRSFTWLPGFYRSFATREHALLCLCRGRRLALIGRRPEAEVGMWYAFFRAEEIRSLRWGELHFGAHCSPALEVAYRPQPLPGKRRLVTESVLYIACADATTARVILADLLLEGLPESVATPVPG